jgi:hypothetical protein
LLKQFCERFNFEIELQVDGQYMKSKNECCLKWNVGKGEKTCKTLSLGNNGSQVIPLLLHLQFLSMFLKVYKYVISNL